MFASPSPEYRFKIQTQAISVADLTLGDSAVFDRSNSDGRFQVFDRGKWVSTIFDKATEGWFVEFGRLLRIKFPFRIEGNLCGLLIQFVRLRFFSLQRNDPISLFVGLVSNQIQGESVGMKNLCCYQKPFVGYLFH